MLGFPRPKTLGAEMPVARTVESSRGPRNKRGAILSVAIESFGKDGYDATKWSTVADQVGIGQPALYHYFESKAHCLLTIMRMELERSHDMFVKATAGQTDAMAALRAAVRAAYEVSEHDVLRMRILENNFDLLAVRRQSAREEAERTAARELVQQIEHSWTELLQRGMDDGVFIRRDARTLALALLGMIVSVWRWYRPQGATPLSDVRELIEAACVRIVMP